MAKIIIDITNEDEEFETFVKIRKVEKNEEPKIKDERRHERRAAIAFPLSIKKFSDSCRMRYSFWRILAEDGFRSSDKAISSERAR